MIVAVNFGGLNIYCSCHWT